MLRALLVLTLVLSLVAIAVPEAGARAPPPQCFRECDPPCAIGSGDGCIIRIDCVRDPCP